MIINRIHNLSVSLYQRCPGSIRSKTTLPVFLWSGSGLAAISSTCFILPPHGAEFRDNVSTKRAEFENIVRPFFDYMP